MPAPPAAAVEVVEEHFVYELAGGVRIRELVPVVADESRKAFREKAEHDVTGWTVWASSVILARFAETHGAALLSGACVVDLGAGCGLAGLAVARCAGAARVVLTDFNATTVANLRHNADANAGACSDVQLSVQSVDWDDDCTWPARDSSGTETLCCIAADVLYRRSYARKVAAVVNELVSPGGVFVCATPGHREGLPVLQQALRNAGWTVELEMEAPQAWRENPLRAGEGGDAGVAERSSQRDGLFPELAFRSLAYPLLVIVWRKPMAAAGAAGEA